jgi:hypothetical protein
VLAAHRSLGSVGRESPRGALSLAVRVWFARTELDRELAEGANPTTDPARELRARQLASPRFRRALAAGLRRLVNEAREPVQSPWIVALPPNRRQIEEAGELLLELAVRLENTEEPCPRAVALASFLVCDPRSPALLLLDDRGDPLGSSERATTAQLARAALDAIDHRPLR